MKIEDLKLMIGGDEERLKQSIQAARLADIAHKKDQELKEKALKLAAEANLAIELAEMAMKIHKEMIEKTAAEVPPRPDSFGSWA